LDRHSSSLTSDVYNADEFVCRQPCHLNEQALVILCSQTGTTTETVRAADYANESGALTVSMSMDIESPLAKAAQYVLKYDAPYTTGTPIDSADSNYAVLYMLLAGIVRHADDVDVVPALLNSLSNLQAVNEKAQAQLDGKLAEFARRFSDQDVIYTTASGAGYGAAYQFAICVLMEMQWINSQAIHANELFHGPFEVVDEKSNFIVMLGLDETRRLEERARDFLYRFGDESRVLVLDAKELDLTGLDDHFKGYLVPLVFFDCLWAFAYKLADLRDHTMLEGRRYMKKRFDY
ncbi:MAG: SIS domain-containing protein, partial [Natronospirillum sp.]